MILFLIKNLRFIISTWTNRSFVLFLLHCLFFVCFPAPGYSQTIQVYSGYAVARDCDDQATVIDSQEPEKISTNKKFEFIIRHGEGGFSDSRSPENKLGGDQVSLTVRPIDLPIALCLSGESYTNSPSPSHNYEISDLVLLSFVYLGDIKRFPRVSYYGGIGAGILKVPAGIIKNSGPYSSTAFSLDAGCDIRLFWKMGFYVSGKYLHSRKWSNNSRVIDFNETIGLIGIYFRFRV